MSLDEKLLRERVMKEKLIDQNIAELCMRYDQIKGANTNIARIAPGIIDGLKPVARRMLVIAHDKNGGRTLRKVAAITGDTIARLHMHGPSSVYSCLVGLAQPWNNNIPLIEGEGNFGSVAGDPAGADRYIQARLSKYAIDCFFSEWKDADVDCEIGADGETMEPLYLPAKYPNILLNGSLGIGYGMASNIPPFNFREVVEATIRRMENPNAKIGLIPDSPTGADIIAGDFQKISDSGGGVYAMRCKYEIEADRNIITITALPYQVMVNSIRDKIADLKISNGLAELIDMKDFSGKDVKLELHIRNDINPYKFMKKLIDKVGGLEKSYPVNMTVVNDFKTYDMNITSIIDEWILYRRERKRVTIGHRRTRLLGEQRTNDVKLFLLDKRNLDNTLHLFRSGKNRKDIELKLIETYRNSEIKMDSLQAKTLSDMRFHELSTDTFQACMERRDELFKELGEVDAILNSENGVDKVIVAELRHGIKEFGVPRRSSVVPVQISIETKVPGFCIMQLSSDGTLQRKTATNVYEEPIPSDSNGFAVKVENDSSFIAVDEKGQFSFIKVSEIPVDQEVLLNRYIKQPLGTIVALLPFDIANDMYCTLISQKGMLKKMKINELKPSKKPCIDLSVGDKLLSGVVTLPKSGKDILIYTTEGRGQRLSPDDVRLTSRDAKGIMGFKLNADETIVGCYAINPENQYLLYVTTKGKMRLNLASYLPQRNSKHDDMVRLITIPDRDKLLRVVGCNRKDKVQVFFDDSTHETIHVDHLPEGTMGTEPKKVTNKSAVSNSIVKVKLV